MANKDCKNPLNVAGEWFCTHPDDENGEGCICCNICYSNAPQIFAEDDNGAAYVKKQPEGKEEEELCIEQQAACPVVAIGRE